MVINEDVVKQNTLFPKNVGELENADMIITHTNAVCGDSVKFYVKLDGTVIKDFKYKVFGCSTVIAISSIFSEFLIFKDIMWVMSMKEEDLPVKRDELEETRKHAYDLVYEGIMKLCKEFKEKYNV